MSIKTTVSLAAVAWAVGLAQAPLAYAQATGVASDESDDALIVVQAQRRSERLVDVPISVSTATSEDLERAGPTSLESLTKVTPGVYLQRASVGLSPTVRGIGSTLPTSSGEQTVAVYVDEIYYPIPTGNVFDLGSVAGVEVLKGPQGTLFGRNATGGAILIRTLDPNTDAVAGKFNASFERFRQIRASGYVNMPLGEKVAINGTVAYRYSRGYVRDLRTNDITNEGRSFTGRGKILIQPTDNLSIVLVGAYSTFDDPTGTDTRNLAPAPIVAALGGPIATDRFHSSFNTPQFIRTKTTEFSGRVKLDLGAGTLSSFTAYIKNRLSNLSDLDGSYFNSSVLQVTRQNTFTQEVNYASEQDPDNPLSYVVGAYYYKSTGGTPSVAQNGVSQFSNTSYDSAIAAYADGSYRFGDLTVIAGIRYTHEKRRAVVTRIIAPAIGVYPKEGRDSQWTPRLGLRYAVGDRSNVYATWSRGFKSGRLDRSTPAGPAVLAEKLDAYEVGFKTASRDFTFNVAGFYYNYKNQQVNATVVLPGDVIVTQLFNAPKSRSYGVDADASYKVSDNFDIRLAAAYTKTKYVDFQNAPVVVNDPTNPASAVQVAPGVFVPGLLYVTTPGDVSGNTMVRAPKFTASASARYHTQIGDNDQLEVTLSPYYSSRVFFTFDNSLSQKAYFTLDGAVTFTLDDSVKLSVFGRNLTDSKYKLGSSQSVLSLNTVVYAQPRTYGASIGYSF